MSGKPADADLTCFLNNALKAERGLESRIDTALRKPALQKFEKVRLVRMFVTGYVEVWSRERGMIAVKRCPSP
jgi:hypothetical protein